jgi:hypothetical protein
MRHNSACSHGQFRMLLGVYSIGALPVDEIVPLEGHLVHCHACLAECAELTQAAAALALLPDEDFAAFPIDPCRCLLRPRRSTSGTVVPGLPRPGRPGATAGR